MELGVRGRGYNGLLQLRGELLLSDGAKGGLDTTLVLHLLLELLDVSLLTLI